MTAPIALWVNDAAVVVPFGANVAAAVAIAQAAAAQPSRFRRSRSGSPRAPFCGIGFCGECRVEIDGVGQQRACLTPARADMRVRTDD
jgi:sarcosine oxidase subunit alpha